MERSAENSIVEQGWHSQAAESEPAAQLLGTNVYGVEIVKNHEPRSGKVE